MIYDLSKIWEKLGIFVTLHPVENESNTLRIFEISKYKGSVVWLYWDVKQLMKSKDKRTTSTDQKKIFSWKRLKSAFVQSPQRRQN